MKQIGFCPRVFGSGDGDIEALGDVIHFPFVTKRVDQCGADLWKEIRLPEYFRVLGHKYSCGVGCGNQNIGPAGPLRYSHQKFDRFSRRGAINIPDKLATAVSGEKRGGRTRSVDVEDRNSQTAEATCDPEAAMVGRGQ